MMALVLMPPGTFGREFSLCVSFSSPPFVSQMPCPDPAAASGTLLGYETGVISGIQTMQNWLCTFGKLDPSTGTCSITSSQQSLVVSILSTETFFGALFAAPAADFLHRRWSVVLSVTIFSVGVAMQATSTAIPLFVVGHVFAGWGVRMVSTLIPMYQSECSPKWIQ